MNRYRFLNLEAASLPEPPPHHWKRLHPIKPEIPEKFAIKLDAWEEELRQSSWGRVTGFQAAAQSSGTQSSAQITNRKGAAGLSGEEPSGQ